MGGLPISLDESSLHEVRINRIIEKEKGDFVDLDGLGQEWGFIESDSRIRSLFDESLGAFISERSEMMSLRPFPVSCSDGRHVNLFKLSWVVRKLGGYDLVSSKCLWGYVAEQCGLRSGASAFLKLIYVKYLKEFDQWLWGLNRESNLDIQRESGRKLDLLVQELEPMFKESLMSKVLGKEIEGKILQLTCVKNSKAVGLNRGGSVAHLLRVGDVLGPSREGGSDDNRPNESEKDLVASRKRGFEEVCGDAKQWLNENGGKASVLEDSNSLVLAKRVRQDFSEMQKNSESDTKYEQGVFCAPSNVNIMLSARNVLEEDSDSQKIELQKNSESNSNYEQDLICAPSNEEIMLSARNDLEEDSDSQKLKRESFSFTNLLGWIKHVAKHSNDPGIGEIPKCSKWDNHIWLQALVVRKARFLDKNTRSRDYADPLQMKLLMDVPTNSVQTKRCTLCKECLAAQGPVEIFVGTELGDKEKEPAPKRNKERIPKEVEIFVGTELEDKEKEPAPKRNKERIPKKTKDKKQVSVSDGIEYILSNESRTHDLLVGSEFQAEVPAWTGYVTESDSKWLGTPIWPPEVEKGKSPLSLLPVGRGRESACDCPRKNSVECVRFHIAEKRFQLKSELGPLFFEWRFNRMGEEVSLSWTPEEEDKFKEVVNSNTKSLWKKLARMFPSKTREMLVSYYFNVYMNQVRSYQNRATPRDIDSDGEDQQYGTIGERFGYNALRAPISSSLVCVENKQCFEFQ